MKIICVIFHTHKPNHNILKFMKNEVRSYNVYNIVKVEFIVDQKLTDYTLNCNCSKYVISTVVCCSYDQLPAYCFYGVKGENVHFQTTRIFFFFNFTIFIFVIVIRLHLIKYLFILCCFHCL